MLSRSLCPIQVVKLGCIVLLITGLVCLGFTMSGCSDEENVIEETPPPSGPASLALFRDTLAHPCVRFTFKVFNEIYLQEDPARNVLISPLSLSIALAMTYNTHVVPDDAMASALELKGIELDTINQAYAGVYADLQDPGPGIEVTVANSMWLNTALAIESRPEFVERIEQFYDAEFRALEFADPTTVDLINEWVETQTRGRITRLLDSISPERVWYLLNATYFRGAWQFPFDESDTVEGVFHQMDGSKVEVAMMHAERVLPYLHGEGFHAVKLPYGTGRMHLCVFVPDADSNLHEFLSQLNTTQWFTWLRGFSMTDVAVAIPRFKVEYDATVLADVLCSLGICIEGRMKHKTAIAVDEEGTEATGATSIQFDGGPVQFTVDRPFFLAVYDELIEAILFMGTIVALS